MMLSTEGLKPIIPDRRLIGRTMAIQRYLRNQLEQTANNIDDIEAPQLALGMDSLHSGPCIYFVGKHSCKDDVGGKCTACGYNRIPFPSEIDEERFLALQFDGYKQLMDDWTKKLNQIPDVFIPLFTQDEKRIVVATGFIGSFFSDHEVSPQMRQRLLEWFLQDFKERDFAPQLYIEARAEDVLKKINQGEFDSFLPLLSQLNTRVILGLESVDDFVRNVIFAKGLNISTFEKAVRGLQERKIGVNAFVFMGNHSMGEKETVRDVEETLRYLKNLDITPVLMTPSLTPRSFNDVIGFIGKQGLSDENCPVIGRYLFTEPRTLLQLLRTAIQLFPFGKTLDHYPFMLSLGGGPPEPLDWMFNTQDMTTCQDCAQIIKKAANDLRISFGYEEFNKAVTHVDDCLCRMAYEEKLRQEDSWPSLRKRVAANVSLAQQYASDYISSLTSRDQP